MTEHLHTGMAAFAFAGVSAVVFMNLLRIFAIWLADKPQFEWLARAIGGVINFSVAGA